MKIVIALLMAVLASVSGFAQEERPANPVRILTAGQHITPYKIAVSYTHLKSFFMNHLVRQYWEQGTHIILIDIGNSYKGLCEPDGPMTSLLRLVVIPRRIGSSEISRCRGFPFVRSAILIPKGDRESA